MQLTTTFKFGTHTLRAHLDENDVPWFVANEVCEALEFANPRDAIATHVDSDDVAKRDTIDSMGRNQVVNSINESGLYALIFGSNKEAAKKFKRWVTSEVLPSIRKKGFYEAPEYLALKADAERAQQLAEKNILLLEDNEEIKDRNHYLERKKAQLIDDHLLNNLREAYMEEIEARKDVEAELHTGAWPAGMDKDTKNYYIGAGKAAALAMKRVAKAFRGVIKGTEWEGCINILCYIEQLEREAKFANVWRKA